MAASISDMLDDIFSGVVSGVVGGGFHIGGVQILQLRKYAASSGKELLEAGFPLHHWRRMRVTP